MNGSEEIFENEQERVRYADVELALHRAMGRMDAPSGLVDRVMARAGATPAMTRASGGRLLVFPRQWRMWAAGAVAAVIVLGVVQGDRIHEYHERQAQAQRQFETAERITDQTLQHTRQQLERAGVSLDGAE